jgi:hypothetical protein
MYMIVHHVIITDQISVLRGTEANDEILDATSDEQIHTVTDANNIQWFRKWLLSCITGPWKFIAYLRTNEDNAPVDTNCADGQSHSDQFDPPMNIRREKLARMNRKLATTSALLYTISMILIYFIPFLVSTMQLIWEGKEIPTAMVLIQFFLFPLGGVMFIFAHTWHKINTVRQQNRRYSWIRAFVAVIMAGGELPPPTVDNDNTRNEQIPSILLDGNPFALKWYDIIGHWKRRYETAKVKKRFKKRSGYVIRRRASEPADQVDSGLNPFHTENVINAHSVCGQEINSCDDDDDDDDLCLLRIQGWMENSTSSKKFWTMTADS